MKKILFDAGQVTWLWSADNHDKIHLRQSYQLDHEIDEKELFTAWVKTMEVYPLLDCEIDGSSGHFLFYEPDQKVKVVKSKDPVCPCTEYCAMRGIALAYFGDTITLTAYHSLMDGVGMNSVAKTLIYYYCCVHFGEKFDAAGIMLTAGRNPEKYYMTQGNIKLGEYSRIPMVVFPEGQEIFSDSEMHAPQDGEIHTAGFSVSAEKFMEVCKGNGATPSLLLSILFGRTAYKLFPEERRNMAVNITMDFRRALEMPETIAQFSSSAMIMVSYEDIMKAPIRQTAARLRSELNEQRTGDYIKTLIDMSRTYEIFQRASSAVISYEGIIDVGGCTPHITGMSLLNNTSNTLHLLKLGERFYLYFQFGLATERYFRAFAEEMKSFGMDVKEETEPAVAIAEVRE